MAIMLEVWDGEGERVCWWAICWAAAWMVRKAPVRFVVMVVVKRDGVIL